MIFYNKKKKKYRISFFLPCCLLSYYPLDAKDARMRKQQAKIGVSKKNDGKLSYELTYEELQEKKDKLLEFGNREGAAKIIEQMLRLCPSIDILAELVLELGDILYTDSQFEVALSTYKNFMQHYQGHDKFEYALFRAIQCSSRLVLHFDRDQTKTEETIELAEKYLQEENCTTYQQEVQRIKGDCLAHLFTGELYTVEFYAKTGKIEVAQKRFSEIKTRDVFKPLQRYQSEIARLEQEYIFLQEQPKVVTEPITTIAEDETREIQESENLA
jgi:outer membrane assembly lipoprotein YfiO